MILTLGEVSGAWRRPSALNSEAGEPHARASCRTDARLLRDGFGAVSGATARRASSRQEIAPASRTSRPGPCRRRAAVRGLCVAGRASATMTRTTRRPAGRGWDSETIGTGRMPRWRTVQFTEPRWTEGLPRSRAVAPSARGRHGERGFDGRSRLRSRADARHHETSRPPLRGSGSLPSEDAPRVSDAIPEPGSRLQSRCRRYRHSSRRMPFAARPTNCMVAQSGGHTLAIRSANAAAACAYLRHADLQDLVSGITSAPDALSVPGRGTAAHLRSPGHGTIAAGLRRGDFAELSHVPNRTQGLHAPARGYSIRGRTRILSNDSPAHGSTRVIPDPFPGRIFTPTPKPYERVRTRDHCARKGRFNPSSCRLSVSVR